MRMMYAVEIMSRNMNGHFQWKDQLVAILNAMGNSSINEQSSVEEILKAIELLEPDAKSTLFGIKVNFKETFKDVVLTEAESHNSTNRFFYTFTTIVVFATVGLIWQSGNSDIEPETLKAFMTFGKAVLELLKDVPLE